MKNELNRNEKNVLKAMIRQVWDETRGEFGYTDMIKVKGLNKHQIAGYIGDLEKKGYIQVFHDFDQFVIRKKAEKVFEKERIMSILKIILEK